MIKKKINVIVVKVWGTLYYTFTLTQNFGIELVAAVAEWSRYRIVAGLVSSSSPEDPPCRGTVHVKSVESSNVLPLAIDLKFGRHVPIDENGDPLRMDLAKIDF
ncbi:hypothetical protein TNCV_4782311 [Trichonephila clavipes]|nr:hypothetical protein TNCV_4782311 [Trichonephila clavipes]